MAGRDTRRQSFERRRFFRSGLMRFGPRGPAGIVIRLLGIQTTEATFWTGPRRLSLYARMPIKSSIFPVACCAKPYRVAVARVHRAWITSCKQLLTNSFLVNRKDSDLRSIWPV